jgi:hypothetical protein
MIEKNFLTQETKDKLLQIRKDCEDLHLPNPPVAYYKIELFDKDGKCTYSAFDKTHTWTLNYYRLVSALMLYNETVANVPKTNNLVLNPLTHNKWDSLVVSTAVGHRFAIYNNSATLTTGIILGEGGDPDSEEFPALTSQIVNGSWTILQTDVSLVPQYEEATRTWTKTMNKTFINASASDTYTIKEIGLLYGLSLNLVSVDPLATVDNQYLMDRTVLSEPVSIPPFASIKITYQITVTMPQEDLSEGIDTSADLNVYLPLSNALQLDPGGTGNAGTESIALVTAGAALTVQDGVAVIPTTTGSLTFNGLDINSATGWTLGFWLQHPNAAHSAYLFNSTGSSNYLYIGTQNALKIKLDGLAELSYLYNYINNEWRHYALNSDGWVFINGHRIYNYFNSSRRHNETTPFSNLKFEWIGTNLLPVGTKLSSIFMDRSVLTASTIRKIMGWSVLPPV